MKRSGLPRPYQVSAIDYNGKAAYAAAGEEARPYPRLLPTSYRSVSSSLDFWTIDEQRRNLWVFPELYFVIARPLAMDEQNIGEDAILGYGIGLCILDDAAQLASFGGTARDLTLCHWYSQYSDNTHFLFDDMYPGLNPRSLNVEIQSDTLGRHAFNQANLNWAGADLLNAVSPLYSAHAYDLVLLGASDKPIEVPFSAAFQPEEQIVVRVPGQCEQAVAVHDLRTPDRAVPRWKPRPFAVSPEILGAEWHEGNERQRSAR